jgi:hypothetical protein
LPAGFRITAISVDDGNVTLTWEASAGQKYRVESRASLVEGAWAEISPDVIAGGASASYTHGGGGGSDATFYRVKTVP